MDNFDIISLQSHSHSLQSSGCGHQWFTKDHLKRLVIAEHFDRSTIGVVLELLKGEDDDKHVFLYLCVSFPCLGEGATCISNQPPFLK